MICWLLCSLAFALGVGAFIGAGMLLAWAADTFGVKRVLIPIAVLFSLGVGYLISLDVCK